MLRKDHTFEVFVGAGNRWTIVKVHPTQKQAQAHAEALLESKQHEAARVVQVDGSGEETVVFEEEGEGPAEKPVTIVAIDMAPVCMDLADFYKFEARKTAGRLMRKYLDQQGITALELAHAPGYLKFLVRKGDFLNQAVQFVASLRARTTEMPLKECAEFVERMVGQINSRIPEAREVEEFHVHIKEHGLKGLMKMVGGSVADENREFFVRVGLAAYLGGAGDWSGKLELLMEQVSASPGPDGLALLDEVIAEILDGAEAIKLVLGPQPDLGTALLCMVQLSKGSLKVRDPGSVCGRLNAILSRTNLPLTRQILLERVHRQLAGIAPLSREGRGEDRAKFTTIVRALMEISGISGGSDMCDAVTERSRIVMVEEGGDMTPEQGLSITLNLLPTRAAQLGFLLELFGTPFEEKHHVAVLGALAGQVAALTSINTLMPPGTRSADIARAVEGLKERLLRVRGEAGEGLRQLALRLDQLAGAAGLEKNVPEPPQQPKSGSLDHRRVAAGEFLFKEGEPGDEAFIVQSGQLEISRETDHGPAVIAILGRGEIVGEMAVIDSQARAASAKALEETTLAVIPRAAFVKRLEHLGETDRVMRRLIDTFVVRLRMQASQTE